MKNKGILKHKGTETGPDAEYRPFFLDKNKYYAYCTQIAVEVDCYLCFNWLHVIV